MCGIMGYTGCESATPVVLEGLVRLEYRGYDSAGVAIQAPVSDDGYSALQIVKACGRLQVLRDRIDQNTEIVGSCGIGHTRWATHGIPSEENAHPHVSEDGSIAVVHNGIIENHHDLRHELLADGVIFRSQTHTEVIVHLLAKGLKENPGCNKVALIGSVLQRLVGSYALGILFADEPGIIYAVRHDSPLMIGTMKTGALLASDIPALLPWTKQVFYPEDGHIIKLASKKIEFFAYDANTRSATDVTDAYGQPCTLTLSEADARRGQFPHFMRKEIEEAPEAVRKTLQMGFYDAKSAWPLDEGLLLSVKAIHMVACGSAYHAALVGKAVVESLCRVPVEAEIASEFRYRNPLIVHPEGTLAVFISQSGETADTVAALRACKSLGVPTLAIVNVQGSTLATEADHVFFTQAGPEIAVATTKAYCAQVAAMYLLALGLSKAKNRLLPEDQESLMRELSLLPDMMKTMLKMESDLTRMAKKLAHAEHIFFIGRGIDHALAMEGSLKLKEISYIHAEAYAAGELKHGTMSLIEEGTPVIALATQPHLYHKTMSNMAEVKARGAYVLCFTCDDASSREAHTAFADMADCVIYLPPIRPYLTPLVAVPALQLLAYHVCLERSLDPDKPRNLAKSVTVE